MDNENVHVIYRWTIHLSRQDEEWDALCGAQNPDLLLDKVPDKLLLGYRICPECQAIAAKTDSV